MNVMTPSIEMAKKIAGFLNTTVDYFLGETEKAELFKDPVMLQRLVELNQMENSEKKPYSTRTVWLYQSR